jgi:cytochrome subunit of sulfide dehydrogenase
MRPIAIIVALFVCVTAERVIAADPRLGRDLAATCANCHGTDGKAQGAMIPLAGRPAADIVSKLSEFKAGKREATIMHQIAKGFTDEQLKLVAEYFAKQK